MLCGKICDAWNRSCKRRKYIIDIFDIIVTTSLWYTCPFTAGTSKLDGNPINQHGFDIRCSNSGDVLENRDDMAPGMGFQYEFTSKCFF